MLAGFRGANWADKPSKFTNRIGNPLFHVVELNWRPPSLWAKKDAKPTFKADQAFLYILMHEHGNAKSKDRIVYVGLTESPATRFGNHERARGILERRGTLRFTYAPVVIRGRNRIERIGLALEELEHLVI